MMSSSSDIEKLFDHFGGDANAYQEIGRENDARTARTRWPLLVTLDLTQPTIPEIGQRREARPQPPFAAALAVDREDTTPKDVASVTRAKAPLFTRSHRRDIPPVVVAASQPAAPSGASRFGAPGGDDESAMQAAPAVAMNDPVAAQPSPTVPPPAPIAPFAPVATTAAFAQPAPNAFAVPPAPGLMAAIAAVPPAAAVEPVTPFAGAPFNSPFRTPVMPVSPAPAAQTPYAAPAAPAAPSSASAASVAGRWAQAPAAAHPYASAPAVPTTAPAAPTGPAGFLLAARAATVAPPASILGKLFAAPPAAAAQPASPVAASGDQPAPLQAVFDRLRGTPVQTHAPAVAVATAAPASASLATSGVSPSWLINGPRRS